MPMNISWRAHALSPHEFKIGNSRLCTKGGMVAIATSAKCTRPRYVRAVFTRVTLPPFRPRYTRLFVSKLAEKSRIACERVVNDGQSSVASATQLAAYHSTRKHAMRLFLPVWAQNISSFLFEKKKFQSLKLQVFTPLSA